MGTKIKCLKCNDIIESMYRHDFKWCSCENVFVDGGNEYLRMGGPGLTEETVEIEENGEFVLLRFDLEDIEYNNTGEGI